MHFSVFSTFVANKIFKPFFTKRELTSYHYVVNFLLEEVLYVGEILIFDF